MNRVKIIESATMKSQVEKSFDEYFQNISCIQDIQKIEHI